MTIEKKNGKLICRAVNGKVFLDKKSCIAYEANVYYPNLSRALCENAMGRAAK